MARCDATPVDLISRMIGTTFFGEAISICFHTRDGAITNISKARITQHHTASLCGLQGILCPLRDHLAFVLRYRCQNVNRELVGVRVINSDGLNTGVHQRCDESKIA